MHIYTTESDDGIAEVLSYYVIAGEQMVLVRTTYGPALYSRSSIWIEVQS